MDKTAIYAIIALVIIVAVSIAITQSQLPGLSLLSPSSLTGNNNISSTSNDNNTNSSTSNSNINNATGQE